MLALLLLILDEAQTPQAPLIAVGASMPGGVDAPGRLVATGETNARHLDSVARDARHLDAVARDARHLDERIVNVRHGR